MKKIISKYREIILIFLMLCILISAVVFYLRQISNLLYVESKNHLNQIAVESAERIKSKLNYDMVYLQTMASYLSNYENLYSKEVNKLLTIKYAGANFNEFSISDTTGEFLTLSGNRGNDSEREYFINALDGKSTISPKYESSFHDNTNIIVLATPIYRDNKIIGVLRGIHYIENLKKYVDADIFDDEGYTYIIDTTGELVFSNVSRNSVLDLKNIFDLFNLRNDPKGKVKNQLINDLYTNSSGFFELDVEGMSRFYSYNPVPIRDLNWYIFTAVPVKIASYNYNKVIIITGILCLFVFIDIVIVMFYFISLKKKQKIELSKLAYTDKLTGGYNYLYFIDEGTKIIRNINQQKEKYALVVFDIDKFKVFNNIFGHEKGDALLRYIYTQLSIYKEKNEIFVRNISDYFIFLMKYNNKRELENKLTIFNKEIKKFQKSLNSFFDIIINFGVYFVEKNDYNLHNMYDCAVLAQKLNKGKEEMYISYYDYSLKLRNIEIEDIENNMRRALEENEYVVFYQPKFSLKDDSLVGAEALVRWRDKVKGMISPDKFIPLFEENGFLIELDYYVFERVCQDIAEWIKKDYKKIKISVNLSRLHLYNLDFIDRYERIRNKYQIPADWIEFELTERAVFENLRLLQNIIKRLRSLGFWISIDDFGSGYSSLNLINKVSVDVLKLDCEFINDNTDSNRGNIVVKSIINMAKKLGMKVVCEGVETIDQIEYLKSVECDMAQGYHYDRALDEIVFENKYLKKK